MPNDLEKVSIKRRLIGTLIILSIFVFYHWLDQNPIFKPTPATKSNYQDSSLYQLASHEDSEKYDKCFSVGRDYSNEEQNHFCRGAK